MIILLLLNVQIRAVDHYMLKFHQNKNTRFCFCLFECHMTWVLLMRKVHLGWDVIFISESEHEFAVDEIFICVLNESFTIWTRISPFGFHVDFNTAAFRTTGADSERRSLIQTWTEATQIMSSNTNRNKMKQFKGTERPFWGIPFIHITLVRVWDGWDQADFKSSNAVYPNRCSCRGQRSKAVFLP